MVDVKVFLLSRLLKLLMLILLLRVVSADPTNSSLGGEWAEEIKEVLQKEPFDANNRDPGLKRNVRLENLCSRFNVQIRHKIKGRKKRWKGLNALGNDNPYTILTIESYSYKWVRIQGQRTQKFLCFNKHGALITRSNGDKKLCAFIEKQTSSSLFQYQSAVNKSWFIGFRKRRGKPLKGADYQNRRLRECFHFRKTELQPNADTYDPPFLKKGREWLTEYLKRNHPTPTPKFNKKPQRRHYKRHKKRRRHWKKDRRVFTNR